MTLQSKISHIIDTFPPISLAELESYTLLDRVDTKYLVPSFRIPHVLMGLGCNYRSLEISSIRIFSYHTTYFDSIDWKFFTQHMTGRGHRSKVRFRRYEQTGVSFLEVKNRTNKFRTEKWRILKENSSGNRFDEESVEFIRRYTGNDTPELEAVLINKFSRITLAAVADTERVTIDFDISFYDLEGKSISIPEIGIIERKRSDFTNRSPLSETLKKINIKPTGFSKFCYGSAALHDPPRKNLLKPKTLLINRIKNECS